MSHKSRCNWIVGICFRKECVNYKKKCNNCLRYSNYVILEQDGEEGKTEEFKETAKETVS